MTDPSIFFWVAAIVADDAVFNPNGIRILLGDNVSKCFINDEPTFVNAPKSIPRSLPNWNSLDFTRPAMLGWGEQRAMAPHFFCSKKEIGKKKKKEVFQRNHY